MKYIVVTGGVISGIGKGVTASSIGVILQSKGYKITHMKIDPYLNYSAGMMAPSEHGEVYVLDDGLECDLDLGNYERFSGISLNKKNAITSGSIYYTVIQRERDGHYEGKTLQIDPHCVNEITDRILKVAETPVLNTCTRETYNPEICIIELGGTVGDAESNMYLKAFYSFFRNMKKEDYLFVTVDFLIDLHGFEHKTKPLQNSTINLRSFGLDCDVIICRTQLQIQKDVIQKISSKCCVDVRDVIALPNLESVYKVPSYLNNAGLFDSLKRKMNLIEKESVRTTLDKFERLVKRHIDTVYIGIVAKYGTKGDSYSSVVHALLFSSSEVGVNVEIIWLDATSLDMDKMKACNGIIVPGGFGHRGIEGKIEAITFCRENNIPLLGICLGLQLTVLEFARNVLKIKHATSEEFDPKSEACFVSLLELNGTKSKTLRTGANIIVLSQNTQAATIYGANAVSERHRHRYGINTKYIKLLEANGLICSGRSECTNVAEIFELQNHKFFVGVQYHPEFNAKPLMPSALFSAFVRASYN